jgi:hypothetical protein
MVIPPAIAALIASCLLGAGIFTNIDLIAQIIDDLQAGRPIGLDLGEAACAFIIGCASFACTTIFIGGGVLPGLPLCAGLYAWLCRECPPTFRCANPKVCF